MSDPVIAQSSPAQGRFIRAALVIFPAGTILLGIASFGVWSWKERRVEEGGYKHALALRREISDEGLKRHTDILKDVMRQPDNRKIPAVAAYLESSMGAENMGYKVRRDRFHQGELELANVDVELTGKQRPREIVLFLVPYGSPDPARAETEVHSIATLMTLAHSMTGEAGTQTLRLLVTPSDYTQESLERYAATARGRDERFMQILVAGNPSAESLAAIKEAFKVEAAGTLVVPLSDPPAGTAAVEALKARLLKAVE